MTIYQIQYKYLMTYFGGTECHMPSHRPNIAVGTKAIT